MIIIKDFTKKIPQPYLLFMFLSLDLIITSLIFNSPKEILYGLKKIILTPDILITDYMVVGGIGATFTNCALLILIYIAILMLLTVKPSGTIIAGVFTVAGFSLFGKNIFNIWPIILGVWIYAKTQKENFSKYILVSIFGTTMSPAFIQVAFNNVMPRTFSLIIGFLISIAMGFLLPPIASACMRLHQGYSLYNVGLAAGLLGTILMSFLRGLGINFETTLIWAQGYNLYFTIMFLSIFVAMIIIGYYNNNHSFNNLRKIKKCSGRLITDFYILFGNGVALINMGILGIFSLLLVLLLGGDLNGPTLGGILTIVGVGAVGKHLKNIIPVMLGVLISTFFNIWSITTPSVMLALLFSTTLSPIAGSFGPLWGIVAGILHSLIVMNTSYLHGGMILYNNGFAGGLVCMFLIPLITAFRKEV